jgi:ATP-dependent Clp protease ATP-binding subunit ClpA
MFWETLAESRDYTDAAKRVIFFARVEAAQLRSGSVEPEHLILGLLRERVALFPHPAETRERITNYFDSPAEKSATSTPNLSAASNVVVNDAKLAAGEIGAIDVEHIVSSLLRNSESALLDVLRRSGFDGHALRNSK